MIALVFLFLLRLIVRHVSAAIGLLALILTLRLALAGGRGLALRLAVTFFSLRLYVRNLRLDGRIIAVRARSAGVCWPGGCSF